MQEGDSSFLGSWYAIDTLKWVTSDLRLGSEKLLRFQEVCIGREEEVFLPRGAAEGSTERTALFLELLFFCSVLFLGFLLRCDRTL